MEEECTVTTPTALLKPRLNVIKVTIIHSHTGGKKMWDHLARHWSLYGQTKLIISFQKEFTLDSLIKANPDIVVCSDPAGAPYQYTKQEVADLVTFMRNGSGRHLIGTYASFFHQEGTPSNPHIYDNRALAGLFGFNPQRQYTTKKLSKQPRLFPTEKYKSSMLWTNISIPYLSYGYSSTQLICEDGEPKHWLSRSPTHVNEEGFFEPKPDEVSSVLETRGFSQYFEQTVSCQHKTDSEKERQLQGSMGDVRLLAHTDDNMVVITNYVCPTFTSLYVSHMPEYESLRKSHADAQFFYNAFRFLMAQNSTVSLRDRCVDVAARNLSTKKSTPRLISELPDVLRQRLQQAAQMTGFYTEKRMAEMFGTSITTEDVIES